MARVAVCGYMIRHPVAGMTLAYFQYIVGLLRLGHQVLYVEHSGWPDSCYDPLTDTHGDDPGYGLRYFQTLMTRFGVTFPFCYIGAGSHESAGLDWVETKGLLNQVDLLLNVGGVCWIPEFRYCRKRALIDMDPFFTQIGRMGVEGFEEHHVYFSYGVNIGRNGCTIPSRGVSWLPTVPPVVPDLWRPPLIDDAQRDDCALTTIASWSAYGGVTHEGEFYGQKDTEFRRLVTLPSRVSQRLELAVGGAGPKAVRDMADAGWVVRDAREVSLDMGVYQRYIGSSRGEFSTAKHAYVKTRSGWFSDRSVCYLAAGRPVIVQESGFSEWLPVGRGVLAFSSLEEAVECIERLNADYVGHCRAAQEIADAYFDSAKVIGSLLDRAMG